ncbi:MAG: transmembrane protein [Eothenomys eva jeilongvirus]|uniref:Transmembrane protein n=1 Tax=Eothenomys eva jeilongvirus TaxID=3028505 RepID=A0AAT9TXH2_9MONO|nr:MAG: transmembrane protein [Eothenomys eva jeilongvirus]
MNTDYALPAPSCSDYETMSSVTPTYKATQLRRTSIPTKRVHYVRKAVKARNYNVPSIYLAFIFVLAAFNFAATCYLIVALETRPTSGQKYVSYPNDKGPSVKCDQLDSVAGSMNSIMHSISYTIPHIVTNLKSEILSRLVSNSAEIRDFLRNNYMNFNVRMGGNKSVNFQSGHNLYTSHKIRTTETTQTQNPVFPTNRPTLVTRIKPVDKPFYPFRSLDKSESILNHLGHGNYNSQDEPDEMRTRNEDYGNMAPMM